VASVPLPLPSLDSRNWDELVAEGRALIPHEAPEWTDHNLHDPGITLLELLAWLSEMLLFRVDRTSPAMLRTFLRRVGVVPRPARAASAVVVLRRPPGAGAIVRLAPGQQVTDATGSVVFESDDPIALSPAWLELGMSEATNRGRLLTEADGVMVDQTALNASGRPLLAFGSDPAVGDALRLGFDTAPVAAGDELALYLWTTTPTADAVTMERLAAESAATESECRAPRVAWPTREQCVDAQRQGETGLRHEPPRARPPWLEHYGARVVWEYHTADGGWRAFTTVRDETRALTVSGRVVLTGGVGHVPGPGDARYWIRCRLAAGGYDCPPALATVALNALPVRHAATVRRREVLGTSRGEAWQRYALEQTPVLAGTTQVRVAAHGIVDDDWREVAEWDLMDAAQRAYVLSTESGTLTFGDGRAARVPEAGAEISVLRYRVGGGSEGNVPAGRLTRLVPAVPHVADVLQPYAASGGAPAETLNRAHGRALERLAAPTRAVTASDLEALALETPGVPVGRATAIANHHPAFPCLPAPGVVTIVALPRCGRPPTPTPAMLDAIARYLERRRPLATELHVVGPDYVAVRVSATLHVRARSVATAAGAAQAALDRLFAPLDGGADGSGWPFGRDVLQSEVLAALAGVDGVSFVERVGITTIGDAAPRCGSLPLCGVQLVDSQTHRFNVVEE
jgi:predicted phage baseplate assembly protein